MGWWVHNLADPNVPSTAPRLIAIGLTFTIVAFLAVALRLCVRLLITKSPGLDDASICFGMLLSIGYTACTLLQTRWGQGLSPEYFPIANTGTFSKIQYAGSPLYSLGLLGFKLALLLAYLRISGFVRGHRIAIYIVLVLCIINQIAFTCILCFACTPIAFQWDPTIPGGKCINEVAAFYSLAATTLAFDIIIIALPIPVLAKLQISTRKKIALAGVFGLGFFVTIIQIIRIFSIKNLTSYTDSAALISWSIIELNLGILTTCIPTFAPLLRRVRGFNSSTRPLDSSLRKRRDSRGYVLHSQSRSRTGDAPASDHRLTGAHLGWDHELNGLTPSSAGAKGTQTMVLSGKDRDDESEEYVIMRPEDGIRATTEVKIESGDGDDIGRVL